MSRPTNVDVDGDGDGEAAMAAYIKQAMAAAAEQRDIIGDRSGSPMGLIPSGISVLERVIHPRL